LVVDGVLNDSWMVVRAEGGKDVEGVRSKAREKVTLKWWILENNAARLTW
jgi:hypothetical protein